MGERKAVTTEAEKLLYRWAPLKGSYCWETHLAHRTGRFTELAK